MFQPCTYGQWTSSLFHFASMTMPYLNCWRVTSPKPRNREDRKRKSSTLTGISPNSSTASEAVFGLKEEYGYKELEDTLIKTYVSVGVKLNHKKAVSLITMLRNKRMIVQENGRKYTFMPDFHY